jgi:hypothetical protein
MKAVTEAVHATAKQFARAEHFKWVSAAVSIVAIIVLAVGWGENRRGQAQGFAAGESSAKAECAYALSWFAAFAVMTVYASVQFFRTIAGSDETPRVCSTNRRRWYLPDAAGGQQVLVLWRARPDRRERHQVREVQRAQDRPTDVRVDVARQAAQPGVAAVQRLVPHREPARLDDLLDTLELAPRRRQFGVPHGHRRREVPERDEVLAQFLERRVCVRRLVGRRAVDERALLLRHLLLQHRHQPLALRPPALGLTARCLKVAAALLTRERIESWSARIAPTGSRGVTR